MSEEKDLINEVEFLRSRLAELAAKMKEMQDENAKLKRRISDPDSFDRPIGPPSVL